MHGQQYIKIWISVERHSRVWLIATYLFFGSCNACTLSDTQLPWFPYVLLLSLLNLLWTLHFKTECSPFFPSDTVLLISLSILQFICSSLITTIEIAIPAEKWVFLQEISNIFFFSQQYQVRYFEVQKSYPAFASIKSAHVCHLFPDNCPCVLPHIYPLPCHYSPA